MAIETSAFADSSFASEKSGHLWSDWGCEERIIDTLDLIGKQPNFPTAALSARARDLIREHISTPRRAMGEMLRGTGTSNTIDASESAAAVESA
jgi:hypothetical protein